LKTTINMAAVAKFEINNETCNLSYNSGFNSYELVVANEGTIPELTSTMQAIHDHATSIGKERPGNVRVSINLNTSHSRKTEYVLSQLAYNRNTEAKKTFSEELLPKTKCLGVNKDYIVFEVTFCNKFVMPMVATSIGGSFGVVMTENKSHVLVIVQVNSKGGVKKQQPGGAWSYGEDPITTCLREVQEETGLSQDVVMNSDVRLLSQRWQSNARPGGISDCMVKFLIYVAEGALTYAKLKPQTDDHVVGAYWEPVENIVTEHKKYLDGEEVVKTAASNGQKVENPYKKEGAYRDDFLCEVVSVLNGKQGYPLKVTKKGDKVNVELC
jgi:ADP-ribose pyrophosphatase YjhB (NUDIX family)